MRSRETTSNFQLTIFSCSHLSQQGSYAHAREREITERKLRKRLRENRKKERAGTVDSESASFFRDFTRCVKRSRPRATEYSGALEPPPLRYFKCTGPHVPRYFAACASGQSTESCLAVRLSEQHRSSPGPRIGQDATCCLLRISTPVPIFFLPHFFFVNRDVFLLWSSVGGL